jgi:hypothetical protein
MGVPLNGWFMRENLIKIDNLGVPPFMETSMFFWLNHVTSLCLLVQTCFCVYISTSVASIPRILGKESHKCLHITSFFSASIPNGSELHPLFGSFWLVNPCKSQSSGDQRSVPDRRTVARRAEDWSPGRTSLRWWTIYHGHFNSGWWF